MEITICNQSSEKKWNRYRHDFEMIVQRASGIIEIPEGGCLFGDLCRSRADS